MNDEFIGFLCLLLRATGCDRRDAPDTQEFELITYESRALSIISR